MTFYALYRADLALRVQKPGESAFDFVVEA